MVTTIREARLHGVTLHLMAPSGGIPQIHSSAGHEVPLSERHIYIVIHVSKNFLELNELSLHCSYFLIFSLLAPCFVATNLLPHCVFIHAFVCR
jgi:hypothetical protein